MKIAGTITVITLICNLGWVYADVKHDLDGKEQNMTAQIKWLGHASFKITGSNAVVYIDPWKLKEASHDAAIALISHSHYDHLSAADIEKVSDPNTRIIAAGDVVKQLKKGNVLKPGQTISVGDVNITGVPAYNPAKKFHPKSNDWLGFIIEIGKERIYYAGDTELIEEMKSLENIDVALLPVGGTYTMDANQAAEAVNLFKPKRAIPYHWGDIVGGQSDAEDFAQKAKCSVFVMQPGDGISFP